VWESELGSMYESADLLVAHNIGFDSRVLKATAEHHAIKMSDKPTACTVKIARGDLKITPAKLDNVCRVLDIPLQHHEALSDSLASAYIYIYAQTGEKHWLKKSSGEKVYEPLKDAEPMNQEVLAVDDDPHLVPQTAATVKPSQKKPLKNSISTLNSAESKKKLAELLKSNRK